MRYQGTACVEAQLLLFRNYCLWLQTACTVASQLVISHTRSVSASSQHLASLARACLPALVQGLTPVCRVLDSAASSLSQPMLLLRLHQRRYQVLMT